MVVPQSKDYRLWSLHSSRKDVEYDGFQSDCGWRWRSCRCRHGWIHGSGAARLNCSARLLEWRLLVRCGPQRDCRRRGTVLWSGLSLSYKFTIYAVVFSYIYIFVTHFCAFFVFYYNFLKISRCQSCCLRCRGNYSVVHHDDSIYLQQFGFPFMTCTSLGRNYSN